MTPPVYGPGKPPRGRDDTGRRKPAKPDGEDDDAPATLQTMQREMRELKEEIRRIKREDTGVTKIHTEDLAAKIDAAMSERDADKRRGARRAVIKWFAAVGTTAAAISGAWYGWVKAYPPPPRVDAADVQDSVLKLSDELEDQVERNRLDVKAAKKDIRTLGREVLRRDDERGQQLDHVTEILLELNPRARRIEPPPAVKKRREKIKRDAENGRVEELFAEEKSQ